MVEVQRGWFISTGLHVTNRQCSVIRMGPEEPFSQYMSQNENKSIKCVAAHVLGSLVLLRFSSAFSSPIPT